MGTHLKVGVNENAARKASNSTHIDAIFWRLTVVVFPATFDGSFITQRLDRIEA